MDIKTKITTSVLTAVTALGGTVASVDILASNGVDNIIEEQVVQAKEVKNTMTLLKSKDPYDDSDTKRLKAHLRPLALKIKNEEKIEVLKMDEFQALMSITDNDEKITFVNDKGEDVSTIVKNYLFNQTQ